MFKKSLSLVLAALMAVSAGAMFTACGNTKTGLDSDCGVTIATEVNTQPDYGYLGDLTGKSLKVGAVLVGDETEGYTEAHIEGINKAVELITAAGGSVDVTWKKKVPEGSECTTAVKELASNGANLVVTNSYGHQFYFDTAPEDYPDTTFIAMTGDLAAASGRDNYKNAFTNIFESRYAAGVIAGLKLKQLVDDGLIEEKNMDGENIRIGYVGAYNYAEVVSGYTAFYLGIKSVVSNIVMHVQYTNSWFNYDAEYQTAKALIAEGCIIIGQHADSEGAPTACEEAYQAGTRIYSVGYNVDMLTAAPHAAISSATNTWAVYYTYAFYTAMTSANGGKDIATNWATGYSDGTVALTKINGKVFKEDPSAAAREVIDKISSGALKVFDASTFTVGGETLSTYTGAYGLDGAEALATENGVTYFNESTIRSAPYFDLRIDGITETGAAES